MAAGETYRIAVLEAPAANTTSGSQSTENVETDEYQRPPVEVEDVWEVTVESVGDQGDGIAKSIPDPRPHVSLPIV